MLARKPACLWVERRVVASRTNGFEKRRERVGQSSRRSVQQGDSLMPTSGWTVRKDRSEEGWGGKMDA